MQIGFVLQKNYVDSAYFAQKAQIPLVLRILSLVPSAESTLSVAEQAQDRLQSRHTYGGQASDFCPLFSVFC
jgi:hypothetical protein